MPRVSIRKLFIYLLGGASFLLLLLNVHQNMVGHYAWMGTGTGPISSGPSSGSGSGSSLSASGEGGDTFSGIGLSIQEQHKIGAVGSPAQRLAQRAAEPLDKPAEIHSEDNKSDRRPKKALDGSPLDPEDLHVPGMSEYPWYMKGGSVLPKQCPLDPSTQERVAQVFPEELPGSDRIPEQLMFFPPENAVPKNMEDPSTPLKKILLWNGINSWGGLRPGRGVFLKEQCPVSSCVISSSRSDHTNADLVLFKDHFTMPSFQRPDSQLWMLYLLECPLHTQMFKSRDVFNWTSTYRSDSTIVAPYERWIYHNENVQLKEQGRNFALNKTKGVAWFVSNCGARNGRLQYAKELAKHIEVDIYGSCGTKRCPRAQAKNCFNMLDKDYKFYLAFENSNCKDYITEKFFVNGLGHDVVPIVMGARPEDYERSAPRHSYIHVDDFSGPKALAEYLHKLDEDDNLYNEYFQWKGTGQFINTKFFCRVCAMLHDPKAQSRSQTELGHYADINDWWRGKGTCINGSWRKFQKALENQARLAGSSSSLSSALAAKKANREKEKPADADEGNVQEEEDEAKLP